MNGLASCVILIFFVLSRTLHVDGLSCIKIDECSCKFDDEEGAVVDLRPLLNNTNGEPLFKDQLAEDGLYYSYNPCTSFNEGNCKNSAICQLQDLNDSSRSLAGQDNVMFGYGERSVVLTYLGDVLPIQAIVTFECVDGLTPPIFKAYGFQSSSRQYEFLVQSACACKNACYSPPQPPTGPPLSPSLGAGSVLLIIVTVLVALYLILGTIHGKVVRKASGVEMLPNYTFWVALPSMVKEGCLCAITCRSCRRQPARTTYDDL